MNFKPTASLVLEIGILIALIVIAFAGITSSGSIQSQEKTGGFVQSYYPTNATASSTKYSVTTSSVNILATSSVNRIATLIQAFGCTTNGTVFLNQKLGAAATSGTGPVLNGTSSLAFNSSSNPIMGTAVNAITDSGTCSVMVTEWSK